VTIEQIVHLIKLDKELTSRIEFITEFDPNIPKLSFDQEAIKQVLWNLIINSISALRSKGYIKISVNVINDGVVIKIEDNGIGISKKKIKNIFNQFYSLKKNGVGMGLSIVKRIIEKHDWNIEVESVYKTGTIFKIIIPLG
jgi:signal transduction histidine kinase